jgi:hypothetical protein
MRRASSAAIPPTFEVESNEKEKILEKSIKEQRAYLTKRLKIIAEQVAIATKYPEVITQIESLAFKG